jgi:hypothetical protein
MSDSDKEQRGIAVESNLFALKRELELKKGRAYTWGEIADAANLNPNTVYGLANNKSQGIRYDTMAALLEFFRGEGLEIGAGDLFTVKVDA